MTLPDAEGVNKLVYWILGTLMTIVMFLVTIGWNSLSSQMEDDKQDLQNHHKSYAHHGADKAILKLELHQKVIEGKIDHNSKAIEGNRALLKDKVLPSLRIIEEKLP